MENVESSVTVLNVGSQKIEPEKSIKLVQAIALVFGMIIGSGIFITVSPTFKVFESNSIGMVMVFWVLGGIIAIVGGLCYAELGTRIPESGGERAYYKKALNEKFSLTFVIIYIFIVKGITLAALALTTGSYMAGIFCDTQESLAFWEKIIACATIVLCFLVNCISKNIANYTNIFFSVMKMAALVLIISFGIYSLATEPHKEWDEPFKVEGFDMLRLAVCFINIFWSYEGWNSLGMVAGDMRNPSRDLPLALIIGTSAVMFFYLLANLSYSAILGYDFVRNATTVATSVSRIVLKKAHPVIPLLICCSTAGALNGNLYATGCVIMSAGYKGELGRVFSLVHRRQRTPIVALFSMLCISFIFLTFDFQKLLMYASFISWMFYFLSLTCLLKLKFSKVEGEPTKIFNAPVFLIFPVQLVCMFTVGMCFYLSPVGCGIFAGIIAAVFIFLNIPSRFRTIRCLSVFHDNLATFLRRVLFLDFANCKDVG